MFAVFLATSLATSRAEAAPGDARILYDLVMNGQKVGTRELTVTTLPRGRRVVEAYTELTVAGTAIACRTTGYSGPQGATFTTSLDQGGSISQVQGAELPGGGWRVITAAGSETTERTLTWDQARFSSLDLMDPERSRALAVPGAAGLVLVESGLVLTGTLSEPAAGTQKIAGQKVSVQRYVLASPLGEARFDVNADGLLVRSELQWLGGTVIATATAVPPPRSYGEVEKISETTGTIDEEPL